MLKKFILMKIYLRLSHKNSVRYEYTDCLYYITWKLF